MKTEFRFADGSASLSKRLLPFLALLCNWVLLGFTALSWGGAKVYQSLSLFYMAAFLWLLIGVYAVAAWRQGRRIGDWADLAVLAFAAYAGTWKYFAPVEFLARIEWLWILSYAAVFFSCRYLFPQRNWLLALLIGLIVTASACCVFALMKLGQAVYPIWGEERPDYGVRISGFFGCPNHFGNFMVLAALCSLVLAGMKQFPWVFRICLFYLAAMLSAGAFFSLSRGSYAAWLAGMIVLLGAFFWKSALNWLWKTGLVLGIVAAVAGGFYLNEKAVDRGSKMLHDDFRFRLFPEAWQMWKEKPWFGYGPASFDFVHQRSHGPEFQGRAYYTHNDYLNTLCDYGAVGLALVLLAAGLWAFTFRRRTGSLPTDRQHELAVLGWAALLAMAVHSMVDFNFHIPACALAFFMIMGAAAGRTERQQKTPLCLPLNFLFLPLSLIAVFFLISESWRTAKAHSILSYNDDAMLELQPESLLALTAKAREWDPSSPTLTVRAADALRVHVARMEAEINQLRKIPALTEEQADQFQRLLERRQKIGEAALDLYSSATAANPLDDTLKVKQGMVLDLMDRSREAYLYYQQAMQNQQHNRFFVHVLGFHFLRQGNLARAKECFREVLRIGLGRRERNRETLDQAKMALEKIEQFEKQQQARPSPPPAAQPPPATAPLPSPEPGLTAPDSSAEAPAVDRSRGGDAPILGPSR